MQPFKRILVDVDAMAAAHPALDRAIALAERCDARLRIVDVVTIPADARRRLREAAVETIVAERERRLAALAAAAGPRADHRLLQGRASLVLIEEVLRSGHDLLVRSHARDLVGPLPRSYGSVDMQLFRKCPCPVWAVGPGTPSLAPRVLAAVHANPQDETEQRLNQKIIGLGRLFADLQDGSLSVAQAWTAFGEEVLKSHASAAEVEAYVEQARSEAARELDELKTLLGGPVADVPFELTKGLPEEAIPRYVLDNGIGMVVMGTVARTGIPGFVIGNTAERLLQRLYCSVVAVKPDGFVTPVQLPKD